MTNKKKICKDCGKNKSIEDFYKRSRNNGKYYPYCKSCHGERSYKSQVKNNYIKEKKSEYKKISFSPNFKLEEESLAKERIKQYFLKQYNGERIFSKEPFEEDIYNTIRICFMRINNGKKNIFEGYINNKKKKVAEELEVLQRAGFDWDLKYIFNDYFILSQVFPDFEINNCEYLPIVNREERGHPDFKLEKGDYKFYVEMKKNGDNLSEDQVRWMMRNKEEVWILFVESHENVFEPVSKRQKELSRKKLEKENKIKSNKLLTYRDLANELNRSVGWVRGKISDLDIKAKTKYKRKKYFDNMVIGQLELEKG